MFEQTKALCDHFLELGIPGFDLIVYHNGKCVLRHIAGYADPVNKKPMTGKEKYHIYSCSKLFTCVAAMQLWEKGLFDLEDKLSDYMPAFKEMMVKTEDGERKAEKPILIRHLFEMTAGLNYALKTPDLLEYYEKNPACPTVETVNQFANKTLLFEPGEGWHYSLCHDVLAALVEVISGQNFAEYVKENIFDPLGMEHSDFLHPVEDWEGFACQYRYDETTGEFQPHWTNTYRPGPEYASGGAGCVSTVEDYIRFLEALRVGDVILKKETIDLMTTDRLTPEMREAFTGGNENGYGLGFRTPREGFNRTEFGWGGAAGAFASVDVGRGISIYYAQHVICSPNRMLRRSLYTTVVADLAGETITSPLDNRALPSDITF